MIHLYRDDDSDIGFRVSISLGTHTDRVRVPWIDVRYLGLGGSEWALHTIRSAEVCMQHPQNSYG